MYLNNQLLRRHDKHHRGTDTHPISEINANSDDATTSYTCNDDDSSTFLLIPDDHSVQKKPHPESPNQTQRNNNNASGAKVAALVPVRRRKNNALLKSALEIKHTTDVVMENNLDSLTNDTCSICYEKINFASTSAIQSVCVTECGHTYHTACVSKMFQHNKDSNCPTCRHSLAAKYTPVYRSPCAPMVTEQPIYFVHDNRTDPINVKVDLTFTAERLVYETLQVVQNASDCTDSTDAFELCFTGNFIKISMPKKQTLLEIGFDPSNNGHRLTVQRKYVSPTDVQQESNHTCSSPLLISSLNVFPHGSSTCLGKLHNLSSSTTFKNVRRMINTITFATSNNEGVRLLQDRFDLVVTTKHGVKWEDEQTLAEARLQNNDSIFFDLFTLGSKY